VDNKCCFWGPILVGITTARLDINLGQLVCFHLPFQALEGIFTSLPTYPSAFRIALTARKPTTDLIAVQISSVHTIQRNRLLVGF
jgi:hypothetical protein